MNYLRSVIRSVLKETAEQSSVIDAIKKKYEVNITYDDGAPGPRRIQPVAYGLSKSGNAVIRAYQTRGDSATSGRGWKLFRLDTIGQWEPDKNAKFDAPPDFNPDGPFNDNGDNSMTTVYLVADFGNGSYGDFETYSHNAPSVPKRPVQPEIQRDTDDNDISGINSRGIKQSNQLSISDMSKTTDFGDRNYTQTSGPVKKNSSDADTIDNQKIDYTQMSDDGPKYKGEEEREETDNDNIEAMQFADDKEEENQEFYG